MADRKRILVADDDPDLLDLLQMDLSNEGYEIVTANNGKDALQIATAQALDAAILDVMMPYIDGYHVASEISSRMGAQAPRILIMTSRDVDREKGIALLSGANKVIQKPFTMHNLHKVVTELLQEKEAGTQ